MVGSTRFSKRLRLRHAWAVIAMLLLREAATAQVLAPLDLSAASLDSKIFLQWHNPGPAIDHRIFFRESGGGSWTEFVHQPLEAPGIEVTGLVNSVTYDFRVSRITGDGESAPSEVQGIEAGPLDNPGWCEVIMSTGQSLAIGAYSLPVLSDTQLYANWMLSTDRSMLLPLTEPVTGALGSPIGETMTSGFLNSLASSDQGGGYRVACLRAAGALPYSSLMQGSQMYNELLTDLDSVKRHCLANGRPAIVTALTVIHGETDEYQGATAAQYEQYLLDWQSDISVGVQARTGQSNDVLLMTDQMSSWMSFGSLI